MAGQWLCLSQGSLFLHPHHPIVPFLLTLCYVSGAMGMAAATSADEAFHILQLRGLECGGAHPIRQMMGIISRGIVQVFLFVHAATFQIISSPS
jgi:hypothetical protein